MTRAAGGYRAIVASLPLCAKSSIADRLAGPQSLSREQFAPGYGCPRWRYQPPPDVPACKGRPPIPRRRPRSRTIPSFSCDIAYSDSPAARGASASFTTLSMQLEVKEAQVCGVR